METNLYTLLPEMVLLMAALAAMLLGMMKNDRLRASAQILALLGLLAAFGLATGFLPGIPAGLVSPLGQFVSVLTAAAGFMAILVAWDMPSTDNPSETDKNYRAEFYSMLLFSLAGVSMMGKVNDLIWMFMALELVSIPTYILVATGRGSIQAQESAIKYFFLGALAAAIFLFGFSYLYGFAGDTRLASIGTTLMTAINAHEVPPLATIGIALAIIGIAYKIAAVPMHFYAADVYQGAATPVTAFLAFAPKAAGFVALIQILGLTQWEFPGLGGQSLIAMLTVLAVLTMTVGNTLALMQRNIKRILAYSSIAHTGYMLVGLVVGPTLNGGDASRDGIAATLFYLVSYAVVNLGVFACLIYLQGKPDSAEEVEDLSGISKAHPWTALGMTICLLSLIGMPLTFGFWGKLYLIQSAFSAGHSWLAIIMVINAAIAAAYYLRIIAAMYLRDPWLPIVPRKSIPVGIAAVTCSVGVILLGVFPQFILQWTRVLTLK